MGRKTIAILIGFLFCCSAIYGQGADVLGVNDRFSDEELIRDVFLKGFCTNVSNIETTGSARSMGNFFNGQDIIGIDEGIIISTGVIDSAAGPNDRGDTSGFIGTFTDEDLNKIATSSIFDISGVSFDFVPLTNRVSFTYVFASDEYCEFVNTQFNDVFGFFVSGPGIDGQFSNNGINVARIPGSDDFVSINNINHEKNADLYIKNELEIDADMCGTSFSPEKRLEIDFDGFTIPLKAEFDVIPCETYTIRLMLSDVHDAAWDSAVFLQMNSFDIGGNLKVTALSETGQDTLISEGCTNGLFRFERIDTDLTVSQSYDLKVTENSTATIGDDIENLDLKITFDPGESLVELPIELIVDDIEEGIEIFGLSLDGQCPCTGGGSANLQISDAESIEADLNGYFACADEEFNIEPNVIGGSPPYSYEWGSGSRSSFITRTISSSLPVFVTVTDFCGATDVASTVIEIQETPTALIDGRYSFCKGVDASVPVMMEGSGPWDLIYRINMEQVVIVEDIKFQPYIIPAQVEGEIRLLAFNDRTCEGIVEGVGVVEPENIEIETFVTPATCGNTFDGSLSFDIISSSPAAEIKWSPDSIVGFEGTELLAGNYQLELIDERGCEFEEIITLGLAPGDIDCGVLNIYIPNVYSPNNDGVEDDFIIHLEHDPSIESVASFDIFDRWGNRVFQKLNFSTTENNIGFDASFNGRKLAPQVLSYVATFNILGGTTQSQSGTITVLR